MPLQAWCELWVVPRVFCKVLGVFKFAHGAGVKRTGPGDKVSAST